jgi:hypothetical protein
MKGNKTHLYRHFDDKGQLLYVGISLSAFTRLSQHKTSSTWANDALYMKTESFDNKELALAAENKAIETEYPKFNKYHNYGRLPEGLRRTSVCSFNYRNDGDKVITGLRIESLPDIDELPKHDLVMSKMDEQIFDVAGNALQLYRIVSFEPWAGKSIEVEIITLTGILGFEYTFEYFEDFRRLVIDPAFEMIMKYSNKSLTYTTKEAGGCITHVVFLYNQEPIPLPTYLEVRAANLKVQAANFKRDGFFFQ